MAEKIITTLSALSLTSKYVIVLLLMTIQSACIPLPSEVIMPLGGSALCHSQFQLIVLATLASLASNLGSGLAYWIGFRGGRPMVERYGSFVLLSRHDLDRVDNFFIRFGSWAVLVGRVTPIIRSFIAFPAGVAKMNQGRFHLFTFIGSWPWNYALAYIGMRLGASFSTNPKFLDFFHRFHLAVEALLLVGVIWFVASHWKNRIRTEVV